LFPCCGAPSGRVTKRWYVFNKPPRLRLAPVEGGPDHVTIEKDGALFHAAPLADCLRFAAAAAASCSLADSDRFRSFLTLSIMRFLVSILSPNITFRADD
jgi:hypothetical protein